MGCSFSRSEYGHLAYLPILWFFSIYPVLSSALDIFRRIVPLISIAYRFERESNQHHSISFEFFRVPLEYTMTLIVNQLIIRKEVQRCTRMVACTASQMHQGCQYQHIRQIPGCMLETENKKILFFVMNSNRVWPGDRF